MPEKKRITLAYCPDNRNTAEDISASLSLAGYQTDLLECSAESPAGTMAQASGKVLLLVTDNFLKTAACLQGTLPAVQKLANENRLLTVVAEGRMQEEDGSWKNVPTSFERVSNVIQYMNHWQDQYLELRKEKRHNESDPALEKKLEATRRISSEIGELLRYLRNQQYFTLEELQHDHFKGFFRYMDDRAGQKAFEKIADGEQHGAVETQKERTLVEIIEDSGEELMAENLELDLPAPDNLAGELTEEELAAIPGVEALMEKEKAEEKTFDDLSDLKSARLDEVDSLLEEVLADEDEDDLVEVDLELEDFDTLFDGPEEEELPEPVDAKVAGGTEGPSSGSKKTKTVPSAEEALEVAIGLFEAGHKDQGLGFLQGAVEGRPGDTTLRYYHAYALARYAQDYSEAAQELETLLYYDRNHADAWFLLAELAEINRDYAAAKNHFEKVASIQPNYPDVYYRLGLLALHHLDGAQEQAAAYFLKALEQDPRNVDAHYRLATVYNEYLGDSQRAAIHFQHTLECYPEHPFAHYDLALLHYQAGEKAQAFEHYQKAVAINPELKTDRNDAAFQMEPGEQPGQEPAFENEVSPEEKSPDAEEPMPTAGLEVEDDAVPAHLEEMPAPAVELEAHEETVTEEEHEVEMEEAIPVISDAGEEAATGREAALAAEPGVSTGRVVFITGATSGIGKATAEIFARNGYRVVVTGRRGERLGDLKESLFENHKADVLALHFDVRNLEEVKAAVENLPEEWKNVDILINNAGLSKGFVPIHEGDLEHWNTMIDTNIKGLLYLTRAIAPHMVERRSGHIINVGSAAGKEVYPNGNVYCATKFAVDALTKAMRLDLFQHNIRVSQVAPGHVEETEFAKVRFDGDEQRAAKVYENFQPLKSSDVAEIIYFIASRPTYVNIEDVLVYGAQQGGTNFIDRSGR